MKSNDHQFVPRALRKTDVSKPLDIDYARTLCTRLHLLPSMCPPYARATSASLPTMATATPTHNSTQQPRLAHSPRRMRWLAYRPRQRFGRDPGYKQSMPSGEREGRKGILAGAMRSKISLTKELRMTMALFDIPVSTSQTDEAEYIRTLVEVGLLRDQLARLLVTINGGELGGLLR
ncbi:hypothetical protein D9611_002849 [Ephemerocybe angulata]|uniref:Uncharacterized protein n=1 Tax=Ephemerocybe angulata TaxID=980116 RepID=A0A8H5C1X3_9AGAR|nr:hypothetical protein D9611_002849 [Tulosesus angulatus]